MMIQYILDITVPLFVKVGVLHVRWQLGQCINHQYNVLCVCCDKEVQSSTLGGKTWPSQIMMHVLRGVVSKWMVSYITTSSSLRVCVCVFGGYDTYNISCE